MLLSRDNMIIGLPNIFFYLFRPYSGDYGMPLPAASLFLSVTSLFPYKVMSKFDKLVDFTFVNLYHVRCAIAEPEVTNAETTD